MIMWDLLANLKVTFYFVRPLVGKDYIAIAGDTDAGRIMHILVFSRCVCVVFQC
jgi:hypothetical protein